MTLLLWESMGRCYASQHNTHARANAWSHSSLPSNGFQVHQLGAKNYCWHFTALQRAKPPGSLGEALQLSNGNVGIGAHASLSSPLPLLILTTTPQFCSGSMKSTVSLQVTVNGHIATVQKKKTKKKTLRKTSSAITLAGYCSRPT